MSDFRKWRDDYCYMATASHGRMAHDAWQAATTAGREAFLQIVQDVRRDRADLFAKEGEPGAALVVHSTCNYIQRRLEEHSCATAIREEK